MRNQILGNRYRILSLIGEGGMASVYKAQDTKLERRVAIKVLHSHLAQNNDIRSRFQQEAKALSGLEHPNVLKVYDFSGAESKQLWIVMEILKGQSLADFVRNFPKSALHPILAAIITQEVCKALAQAHTQGIVHRDVKPDNIMVLNDGRIKLMDFGIAKDVKNHSMTMTGTFMGSPSYMSPEQIRGRDIDHRSDIYSLGVMFYEIITGVLPFTGGSTADVINKIIVGKYMEPAQVINGIPPELNALVVKAITQEPLQRHQKSEELLDELTRFLSKHGFVESHIELERFFRDRATFESRLRKLHFSSGRVRSAQYATESSYRAATTHAVPQDAQTEFIPPPIKRQAQTRAPEKSTKYSNSRSTQYSQRTQVERTTVTDRRRLRHPLRVGRRSGDEARGPFERLMGIGIVLAMAIAALVSFISFTRVFEPAENVQPVVNEVTKTKPTDAKVETKKDAAPMETPSEAPAPAVDTKTASKPLESAPVVTNRPTTKPRVDTKRQRVTTRTETRASSRTSSTKQPSAPVVTAPTTKPTTNTSVTTNTTAPTTTSTPSPAEQATSTPPPAAKTPTITFAQITIQSQPAAEIFINGRAHGTTNDPENRRRGVRMNPGAHRIELKRRGYTTLTRSVQVEAGDTRALTFKLEKEAVTRFTVTSNKSPAKLIIEEKGGNFYRRELNIMRESASVNLAPGTYRIRVEYGSQIMERNITLTPGREALTFTADFKEE